MSPPLRETLDEYLTMRRALGHKLCLAGRLLQQFVAFADLAGATYVTTDLALAWVSQPCGAALAERARRLGIVRRFAQYCGALDSRTIVPPQGLLPHRYQRPTPYIYRDEEISRLLGAARQLSSSTGLRPHTYSTPLRPIRGNRHAMPRTAATRS